MPKARRSETLDALQAHVDETHQDGWASSVTQIGTSADKRTSHTHGSCRLSYEQITQLWETDDVTAKAIEAPGKEALREGYEIVLGNEGEFGDLKEEIEERLEELDVEALIEKALQYRRAYGGGAMILGVENSGSMDQPLDLKSGKPLKWINVLEPVEIRPSAFYEDPMKAKYNEPEFYALSSQPRIGIRPTSASSSVVQSSPPPYIHESRVIAFQGIMPSKYMRSSLQEVSPYWGASIVPRFYETLRDHGVSFSGAGLLATDVSQPVITIDGLRSMVAKNSRALHGRMAALELGRSVARAILLDKDEKFERQTTQLAGIPDLLDRMSQRLAAAVDIPLSVLFGYSPASLGTPGSAEMTQWYNAIRKMQRREITPVLRYLINLVMRSLRQRKLPTKYGIRWHELEHQTDDQRAGSRLTQARTDSMYIKAGVVTSHEVRRSRFHGEYSYETQVDESEEAPGFVAPQPAGVIPGSTPASGVGPNAHTVTSYARRNPEQPTLGKNTPEGEDATPGLDGDDGLDEFDVVEHLDRVEQRGDRWVVLSEDRSLQIGDFATETAAIHRLAQIEHYKRSYKSL